MRKINTPAVLKFILLSHDDVETHASMAIWRTSEIDIYLFWLCIQIWYLIFDFWFLIFDFHFLFYFSVPFFSLSLLCFWESFSFERFCLNMLTDWKHTFFNNRFNYYKIHRKMCHIVSDERAHDSKLWLRILIPFVLWLNSSFSNVLISVYFVGAFHFVLFSSFHRK